MLLYVDLFKWALSTFSQKTDEITSKLSESKRKGMQRVLMW